MRRAERGQGLHAGRLGLYALSAHRVRTMTERPLRVHRLFVDAELGPQSTVELPEAAAHHAARVLRLRDGDAVVLFDGRGGEYEARLVHAGPRPRVGRDRRAARPGARIAAAR